MPFLPQTFFSQTEVAKLLGTFRRDYYARRVRCTPLQIIQLRNKQNH